MMMMVSKNFDVEVFHCVVLRLAVPTEAVGALSCRHCNSCESGRPTNCLLRTCAELLVCWGKPCCGFQNQTHWQRSQKKETANLHCRIMR